MAMQEKQTNEHRKHELNMRVLLMLGLTALALVIGAVSRDDPAYLGYLSGVVAVGFFWFLFTN